MVSYLETLRRDRDVLRRDLDTLLEILRLETLRLDLLRDRLGLDPLRDLTEPLRLLLPDLDFLSSWYSSLYPLCLHLRDRSMAIINSNNPDYWSQFRVGFFFLHFTPYFHFDLGLKFLRGFQYDKVEARRESTKIPIGFYKQEYIDWCDVSKEALLTFDLTF